MVNYSKTKIYKIESKSGEGQIYVGSTTKDYLSQRFDKHRSEYKSWINDKNSSQYITSYKIFDEYGLDNCHIILLESYPCNTSDEKKAREAYYIKQLDCVNKFIPGRSQKEYYNDNKEYILEINRAYKLKHKDELNKKYICECGGKFTSHQKSRHLQSTKHKNYLTSL